MIYSASEPFRRSHTARRTNTGNVLQPFDRSHLNTVYIAAFEKGVGFVEALGVYPIRFLSHNSDYYSRSFTSNTVPHFGQVIVFEGCGESL